MSVCTCTHSNSTCTCKRLRAKIWHSATEKALLTESRTARAEKQGALDPFSLWWGCQLPRLTPKPCSQHLGSIMFWSSCLWYFLLCSWHIWTHWIFNSDLRTCFCWIIAFSPLVVLWVIPWNEGIPYTFFMAYYICPLLNLSPALWHSPLTKTHLSKFPSQLINNFERKHVKDHNISDCIYLIAIRLQY